MLTCPKPHTPTGSVLSGRAHACTRKHATDPFAHCAQLSAERCHPRARPTGARCTLRPWRSSRDALADQVGTNSAEDRREPALPRPHRRTETHFPRRPRQSAPPRGVTGASRAARAPALSRPAGLERRAAAGERRAAARAHAAAPASAAAGTTCFRPRPTASKRPARRGGGRAARGMSRPFRANQSGFSSARRPSWL
jgi:hypothetical protein